MSPAQGEQPPVPEPLRPLDDVRVAQVAKWIVPGSVGPGRPIADREAWSRVARSSAFAALPAEAAKLMREPPNPLTEAIYFDHVRTGGQEVYNHYNRTTRGRFTKLVLAECVEDHGRFLPAIHASIYAICAEPTWVHAFHDRQLNNWHGKTIEIDLSASTMAYRFAVADRFLGDRLEADVRTTLATEVERRVGVPFEAMLEGQLLTINQDDPFTWLELSHNWNAVCLANVVGTTLLLSDQHDRRARCVAAAERYIRNFLSGFGSDGSCSEGMNYWNFGFSHFLLLGETLWQATRGAIDLFDDSHVASIARFGARMEIVPGIYPAFADCHADVQPLPDVMRYVSRRFGLGLPPWEAAEPEASGLPFVANFAFPNSSSQARCPAPEDDDLALRSWFDEAQLFVGRPGSPDSDGLGVAFKGGSNAEQHNHNDLGSYMVAAFGEAILSDPGSELYTTRTFGPRRYESNVLNSWGHPVPLVNAAMQQAGGDARAIVLEQSFDPAEDRLELDLRRGYDVPSLTVLRRSFLFSRQGAGTLTVTDVVKFSVPSAFETALVTFASWTQRDASTVSVTGKRGGVQVDINVTGGTWHLDAREIAEDVTVGTRPTRIGIVLDVPVTEARVQVTIRPVAVAKGTHRS